MMDFGDHGMGATGWLLSGLVMLLFWGTVVAVLVAVVRGLRSEPRQYVRSSPLRLLEESFARGELDEPEYLRRRDVLTGVAERARPRNR